jgi:hypothetical protein
MPGSAGTLAVVSAFAGLFLGGGAAGVGLAALLAPGSWLAQAVGLFALPVAFAAGLQAWQGLALFGLLLRLLGRRTAPVGLPGSFVFLPLSSGAGALAGTIVGLASSAYPWWLVGLSYWVMGTAHGLLAWRLGRQGVLCPPSE